MRRLLRYQEFMNVEVFRDSHAGCVRCALVRPTDRSRSSAARSIENYVMHFIWPYELLHARNRNRCHQPPTHSCHPGTLKRRKDAKGRISN